MVVVVAVIAAVGVLTGLTAYWRARFRRLPYGAPRRGVRRSVALTAVSGVALVVPDVVAGQATAAAEALVYRGVALGWLVVVGVLMALTSARVVDPLAASVRRLDPRRRVPAGFPTSWDALVERDRALAARLLSYDRDLELAVNAPVMRDYSDPHTAAAVRAMLHCDVVRTPEPPLGTRSIARTEYGQAVAAFEEALAAAEANAHRLAASTFTDDERRALDDAARTLQFLRTTTTTPAERAAAYEQVRAMLDVEVRRPHDPAAVREHPFLDVVDRAR